MGKIMLREIANAIKEMAIAALIIWLIVNTAKIIITGYINGLVALPFMIGLFYLLIKYTKEYDKK